MIFYKTNKNWFGDLVHLYRSWTMNKIMRGVVYIGIYSTAVCLVVEYQNLGESIYMNVQAFSLLGVILSIFLVFRTNTAYDRWWEGRKQWGALVNNTRNLAVYIHAMFPKHDYEVRHCMAKYISNFCYALVEHLRDGVKLDKLIYLSDEEEAVYKPRGIFPITLLSKFSTASRRRTGVAKLRRAIISISKTNTRHCLIFWGLANGLERHQFRFPMRSISKFTSRLMPFCCHLH